LFHGNTTYFSDATEVFSNFMTPRLTLLSFLQLIMFWKQDLNIWTRIP